jgi:hypothetical protein
MEKLAKAKKLGLVLSPLPTTYYLGLTCHGLDMHAFCVLYDYSKSNQLSNPTQNPQFGLLRFAISSQGDLSKGGPTVEHPT